MHILCSADYFLNKQSWLLIDKINCCIKRNRANTELTCVKNLHMCDRWRCARVRIFLWELCFNILVKLLLSIGTCKLFFQICCLVKLFPKKGKSSDP